MAVTEQATVTEETIQSALDTIAAAVCDLDGDALTDCFTDDAEFSTMQGTFVGKDAIREYFHDGMAQGRSAVIEERGIRRRVNPSVPVLPLGATRYAGGRPAKIDAEQRDQIVQVALARTGDHRPPFSTWSLSKLADYLVAQGVDDISHEWLRMLLREQGVSCPGRHDGHDQHRPAL